MQKAFKNSKNFTFQSSKAQVLSLKFDDLIHGSRLHFNSNESILGLKYFTKLELT